MNRVVILAVLLVVSGLFFTALAKEPPPEIMRLGLGMSRQEAHDLLKSRGKLEKEERKRQEVWTVDDPRVSHLLVGYDSDFRLRYVTAIARANGPHIRYTEVADIGRAQRTNTQGNYRFTWEVPARGKQPAYIVLAHGRSPNHLDSYSIKAIQP